ncbi:hypothetical protein PIROE2DRAFT_17464 [Piromyces sp. E2]|nr:hypothetical protein PIROE2DRAFT_17464 [Piromyces sp. E2]|eukprot:OUM57533.1 hypothetical protein PIROE2DRAFT_17464 [Piromyces sp. E2]
MVNFVFNPGTENFKIILTNKFFVDKTKLIKQLNKRINTVDRFICVSRPRRFGKTVIADMLVAYYSFSIEKTDIFNDKKIAKTDNWDKYLGELNVIKLNMIDYFTNNSVKSGLSQIKNKIVTEVKQNIPDINFTNEKNIVRIFEDIYKNTQKKIVLIIDEWDIILRDKKNSYNKIKKYLKFLNQATKDKQYIALAYITGILPIKRYGVHSSLDFNEYTMISSLWMSKYIGFSQSEVKILCKKLIDNKKIDNSQNNNHKKRKLNKELNNKNENDKKYKILSFDEELKHKNNKISEKQTDNKMLNNTETVNFKNIKKWYNGYKLYDKTKKKIYKLYTPYSIVKALNIGELSNYWNRTETYFALSEYIELNILGLKEDIIRLRNGKRIKINIDTYQNDMTSFKNKDDILTMLVHLGYLNYDIRTKEVFIPNKEVLQEFISTTDSDIISR